MLVKAAAVLLSAACTFGVLDFIDADGVDLAERAVLLPAAVVLGAVPPIVTSRPRPATQEVF